MPKAVKYLLLIGVFYFAFQPEVMAQCAMCKQSVESSMKGDPNSLGRSLNSGILYLMAVPYLLIAFIFRKQIYQLWRRMTGKPVEQAES